MARLSIPPRSLRLVPGVVAMLVALAGGAYAECFAPWFTPASHYPVGPNPHGAASGDFDGDGDLDIAVANSAEQGGSPSVALLFNLGNGTFAPAVHVNGGPSPYALAAADFDEDGDIDLAVANHLSNVVTILKNNGSGAFAASTHHAAGNRPFEVEVADFNEDGILDLAVPNNGVTQVVVLLGTGSGGVGDGGFATGIAYPLAHLATGIAAGDLDGDGIVDLAVTQNYGGAIAILRGVGDGTFGAATYVSANTEPFAVELADLDQDGDLDLISGDAGFDGVAVLLNAGGGAFSAPTIFNDGVQNAGLVIGDWNNDGDLDVASADGRSNSMFTMLGNGAGGLGSADTYAAGAVAFPMTSGDFDGNGATDLVTVNYGGASISVFYATCSETPPPPPPSNAPVLTDVRDVPNDQGGRVFLTWLRSRLDTPAQHSVTGYRIWRRIHPEGTSAMPAGREGIEILRTGSATEGNVEFWEAIAVQPAQQLEGYGYTAPTTQDRTNHSNPYTAFFVTALTANPAVFYNSNVDSGYSVDNLPPHGPNGLAAQIDVGGYRLNWEPNIDPDVERYQVYRGGSADFPLDAAHRIAAPEAESYLDPGVSGTSYYKVTAIDKHDNEGPPAVLDPNATTSVGDAVASFALHGPNPARAGRLAVDFSLPGSAPGRIDLFDARGRRVASHDVGMLGAGNHRLELARGRAIGAGIYWVRLSHGALRRDLKVAVLP